MLHSGSQNILLAIIFHVEIPYCVIISSNILFKGTAGQ